MALIFGYDHFGAIACRCAARVFNFGVSLLFAVLRLIFVPDPAVLHAAAAAPQIAAGRTETRAFRDRLLTRQTHSPPRQGLSFGFAIA